MSAWRPTRRLSGLLIAAVLAALPAAAEEQRNMRLVGYDDLQARSAYQPVIQQPGRALDRLRRPPRRHSG